LPGFSSQADSENPYFLAIYARSQHDFIGLSLFWPRFGFSRAITIYGYVLRGGETRKRVTHWGANDVRETCCIFMPTYLPRSPLAKRGIVFRFS